MKIAFISGINYLEFAKEGKIDFTLCSWILNHPEYAEHYKNSTKYKITDNMAAEIGVSIDIQKVLEAARVINADEVWASDKLYDKKETLKLTKRFLESLKPTDKFKICGIVQGKNFKEWLECYKKMLEMPRIDVIALSKYSCPEAFYPFAGTRIIGKARPVAVEWLHEHDLVKKPLHLAGADNFIIQEIKEMKKYPMVRSIDSNIAFKLGVHRLRIDETSEEPKERLDHNIKNLDKEQLEIIKYNINKIKNN